MTVRIALIVFLFALAAGNASAGQLSPDLIQQLNTSASNDPIRVWIKLPVNPQADPARSAVSIATSAAERHRSAIAVLKSAHGASQAGVAAELNLLRQLGKAANIKQHWLVNVIEAQVSPTELAALAARADIETIQEVPRIISIKPVAQGEEVAQTPLADTVTPNLRHVKANEAHAAGFTGTGRVICSFDTGIDGAHPALQNSWKGRGGTTKDSLAAWFDPRYQERAPHVIDFDNHGTHTMGLMVGRDAATGTIYGVAPGAKWISAAIIDIAGASILDAFEWACDPDGDPNTASDVPDVINHSWGYEDAIVDCDPIFFEAIDKTEALGIVNIFAAGNDGPLSQTIRNPANGARDSLDCFSVGMINLANPPVIDNRSSRGPSACIPNIKPNVVAPGVSIWSSVPGGNYTMMSGTSMSVPHVSGLVALLRQKNPAATVRQIKEAILRSTQRYSWSVPNNDQGWGEIDCIAALNALPASPTTPMVRLYDFVHGTVLPGSVVEGPIKVQNLGGTASSVTGTITGSHPSLTILSGTVNIGTAAQNTIATSTNQIRIQVADTVTEGTIIRLPFQISGTGFQINTSLAIVIEPPQAKMIASHTGLINFSLSNYGVLGLGPGVFYPAGGLGFTFGPDPNFLTEGGILLGTGAAQVSSGVHSYLYEPDMDFRIAPGGNITFRTDYPGAMQYTVSKFTDANATLPLGVHITQESFSFTAPNDDHVILRYILRNLTSATITGMRFGLYLDWDIIRNDRNAGGYDAAGAFAWMSYSDIVSGEPNRSKFRGVKLLEGQLATALTGTEESVNIPFWGGPGFTSAGKWSALAAGTSSSNLYEDSSRGLFQLLAAGPITLAPGEATVVAFSLLAGNALPDMSAAADKSVSTYTLLPTAPSAVTLIYPVDIGGSAIPDLLPTFEWTLATDANPDDSITYTLQYDDDPLFGSPVTVTGLTTSSYTAVDSLEEDTRYWWRVTATDKMGLSTMSLTVYFTTDIVTGGGTLPKTFALYQNYPNPFNPSTVIAFDLPEASTYVLTIFDITGREIHRREGYADPGRVELEWNVPEAASGLYLYKVSAGEFAASRKMLLLK